MVEIEELYHGSRYSGLAGAGSLALRRIRLLYKNARLS